MSKMTPGPTLRRILLEAVILCALAMTVGLSLNYRMVMNAFSGRTIVVPKRIQEAPPLSEAPSESRELLFPDPVELDELDDLLAAGALLVDARNDYDYAKQHLPGAVSLPLAEVESRLPEFLAQVPKEQMLITYCNGFGCPDSFDLGVRLLREGYQQVRVFEGGFPQWRDAGRPLEGKE